MKTFLFAFSILVAFPVFGQNYRTVSTDSEVYFDFKDYYYNASRVIFTDSFQVIGNDTIIYHQFNQEFEVNYSSFYDSLIQSYVTYDCFMATDTGFLSYKTILKNDGMDIYFNRFHDSIFIKTQANLNNTWIFYTDSVGNYFEATVSNISYDNFLGISDSVKTIHLQAKNSLGNNISSPYDTLNIKISKYHGLIEGFNLFRFPYGTTINNPYDTYFKKIKLIGLPYLNVGVDNLTAAEIYDFEIGDEFQRLTNWTTEPTIYGDYEFMRINSKGFSQNNDTVFYDVYLKSFSFSNSLSHPIDTIFIGDTTIFYDISANQSLNTKSLLLDTITAVFPILWVQSYDGLTKYPLNYYTYTHNGCFQTPFPSPSNARVYKSGFGIFEWGYYSLLDNYFNSIIYYKKNGIEWGTLVDIPYLLHTDAISQMVFNLNVFPNPTNNLLNFQFKEPINNAEIRIYSSIGQLVGQTALPLPQMNVQFDVSDWSSGIYFYGVLVEGVLVKQGQVLVNE